MAPAGAAGGSRRGRWLVLGALLAAAVGLTAGIIELSTRAGGPPRIELSGTNDAQRLFGGIEQDGDRLGAEDAPVSIQVYNDITCDDCSDHFLDTVPALVEDLVRPGEAKLLYRHYAFGARPVQLAFVAAEAASEQDYEWPYVYIFFASQAEAERVGVQGFDDFIEDVAGAITELEPEEWERDFEEEGGADGELTQRLEEQERVARDLGLRAEPSVIVSGPGGTEVLQDSPSLDEILEVVDEVR